MGKDMQSYSCAKSKLKMSTNNEVTATVHELPIHPAYYLFH